MGSDTHVTTLTLDAEISMVRSLDGAQRNPGIGTEAKTVSPGMRCATSGLPISPSFGAGAVFPVNRTTLTLDAEISMVRSLDRAQRNPGIGTEATTVFPGMRCATSGLPTSPSFGAGAVFPVNGT
jgi:hypothetical protein